ncbi:MAG TPA: type II toxin-antitoxin system prevent-host-death family antitoxin [Candidatus Obscuribacterales bacterium]
MKKIGAYEAKTHLPRLLEEVARGERITITKHGVPIAMIVPVNITSTARVQLAIEQIRGLRKQMSLRGLKIKDLIEEGRRF